MSQNKIYREGAIGALLDEYEKALNDLKQVLAEITDEDLIIVIDSSTVDPNCKSVQTILSHVVSSGFGYAISIRQLHNKEIPFRDKIFHTTLDSYQTDLHELFEYTVETLQAIKDNDLEQLDNSKKIISRWGQQYDPEQIMEHAIVHILRHRRQIEKFILKLRNIN